MSVHHIKKGRDIKLKGAAEKTIVQKGIPSKAAVIPPNFRNIKHRVLVKEGPVQVGTPILEDKENTDIKFVSPVSGNVVAVNRGHKRTLLSIVIDTDGKQDAVAHKSYNADQINSLSRDDIITQMLPAGLWPALRQRPFSKIANPAISPKSIFVRAMNSDPLALDIDFVLQEHKDEFQIGLNILSKLTDGAVNLCFSAQAKSATLLEAEGVQKHQFSGAHPSGNVSTHIYYVDPINKGDVVWFIEAQDVLRLARLFLTGKYDPTQYVAIVGEGASNRTYAKTVLGAAVKELVDPGLDVKLRYISGSVLSGTTVGADGFVGFYDSQVTVIPEGGDRKLLGWLTPGFNSYTFSNTFASAFLPQGDVSLDADENGSHRAIVLNHLYDGLTPLDLNVYFLLRAVISCDIEEAEKMGILEVDEEDFALCTFACPSKTDVGGIIREGLDLIEKEG